MSKERDLEDLRRALAPFVPSDGMITNIRPLTTGFSNDTYIVEGCDLILRFPPSAGAMLDGHDVIGQARIYEALGRLKPGLPVPAIVAICDDISVAGDPFFLMERVAGEAVSDLDLQDWYTQASDEFRHSIGHQWVTAFASLAALQPLAVLGAAVSPEDDARRWRQFALGADCPRLAEQFDRLLQYPAPLSGPTAVVHGDPKLSNLMFENGRMTAVLDWEMALNGEPLADLAYLLYGYESAYHAATRAQKLGGALDRDAVISLWSQVSGRSADGLIWHEVAQIGKIAAIIAEGANMFVTGRSEDPKLAIFMTSLEYYLGVMGAMLDAPDLHALKG